MPKFQRAIIESVDNSALLRIRTAGKLTNGSQRVFISLFNDQTGQMASGEFDASDVIGAVDDIADFPVKKLQGE